MPPGTLIPELGYPDVAGAVRWLCATFGFRERLRIGTHRCQLQCGDASLVVMNAPAPAPHSTLTHALMVRVADVDRHYAHVQQCGARILSPPADYPYGERQYTVEDLGGHCWTFSQSIADVDPPSWGGVLLEPS